MKIGSRQGATGNSRKLKFVLCALCALLLALSHSAEAQQQRKMPLIGYLEYRDGTDKDEAFLQSLRDLGWIEGQNIAIRYQWAQGNLDRLPTLAKELVQLKVDLIVARTATAVRAAKNATTTIPIVISVPDAVGSGLVASLARPGGNITGTSSIMPELAGKRLELLREILPKLSRVAFLAHAGKAGARTLVNASPEPFSNVIVSTGEDIATGGLLALAIANPIAAALIALILVVLSIWLVIEARRFLRGVIDRLNPPPKPTS